MNPCRHPNPLPSPSESFSSRCDVCADRFCWDEEAMEAYEREMEGPLSPEDNDVGGNDGCYCKFIQKIHFKGVGDG